MPPNPNPNPDPATPDPATPGPATPGPATVVAAIIAAREADDLDTSLSFVAPASLDQGRPSTRADWRAKWEAMRAGIPDLTVTTEHRVEQGEWVSHRYLLRGTSTGTLFGQPTATGPFEIHGLDMVRVRDGLLVEHWAFTEPLSPA